MDRGPPTSATPHVLRAVIIAYGTGSAVLTTLIVGVPALARDLRTLVAGSGIVIGATMSAGALIGGGDAALPGRFHIVVLVRPARRRVDRSRGAVLVDRRADHDARLSCARRRKRPSLVGTTVEAYGPAVETPYGDIPDRLVGGMRPQEMHDYLKRRYTRRSVLRGAAATGLVTAASPILWRQSSAVGATVPIGPRWIAYGPSPASQMYVSWSAGTAGGSNQTPSRPRVRWGLDTSYGSVRDADSTAQVPIPSRISAEPVQNTFYNSVLLNGLLPGRTYHYGVSNDGVTWSADASFTTGAASPRDFRFTAYGDQAARAGSSLPMVKLAAAMKPAFHVMAGDLSYSTTQPIRKSTSGYSPARWDNYLAMIGAHGAQSIPWNAAVGAHETEPLDQDGYAGFVTRMPQAYDLSSGSPVLHSFVYGNVAIIALDGNDLSAEEVVNNGYSGGGQTAWLARTLAGHRAAGSAVDFVVVVCNCNCYSTNKNHSSDGGVRDAFGPLFDRYGVDLVISGHVHAYERTYPIRAGRPTRVVASGGTVHPVTDGTTYICAGGGGNGLYRTWLGPTGGGDSGTGTTSKVWRWSGGDTAAGGSGTPTARVDATNHFSAYRRAVYSCLVIDVTAPAAGQTTMHIRALMPAQNSTTVTSIAAPVTMDSVTLVRPSPA